MMSYEKAKKEIKVLINYIELIDNFEINTIENLVIYEYAKHNSISKVIKEIRKNHYNIEFEQVIITPKFITSVILGKPQNELHSIIKTHYLKKTRAQRKCK